LTESTISSGGAIRATRARSSTLGAFAEREFSGTSQAIGVLGASTSDGSSRHTSTQDTSDAGVSTISSSGAREWNASTIHT